MTPYYSDDLVTIYHGDCREVTEWLNADVLITDPPYGMALRSGWSGAHGTLHIANDHDTQARDAALTLWGTRPALVFGRWSITRPRGTRMVLTWDKGEHVGMGDLHLPWKPNTEEIYVLGSGFSGTRRGSVLRFNAPPPAKSQGRLHPTEKPLDLLLHLVKRYPVGVVADPFCGSGSTIFAAKTFGRHSIGVELDERYCEIAAERCRQEVLAL